MRDGDLAHQLAVRCNDEKSGVAGKRGRGIKTETRHIDITVGPDGQTFDARRHARCYVRQNRQNVHVAAVECARGRYRQCAENKSNRCSDDPTSSHVTPPEWAGAPRGSLLSRLQSEPSHEHHATATGPVGVSLRYVTGIFFAMTLSPSREALDQSREKLGQPNETVFRNRSASSLQPCKKINRAEGAAR